MKMMRTSSFYNTMEISFSRLAKENLFLEKFQTLIIANVEADL